MLRLATGVRSVQLSGDFRSGNQSSGLDHYPACTRTDRRLTFAAGTHELGEVMPVTRTCLALLATYPTEFHFDEPFDDHCCSSFRFTIIVRLIPSCHYGRFRAYYQSSEECRSFQRGRVRSGLRGVLAFLDMF
jgi:hypothetical protein